MTQLGTGVRAPRDKIATVPYRPEGAQVTVGQTFAMGWLLARAATGTLQVMTETPGLLPGGFADRDFYQAAISGDRCLAETGIYSVEQSALSGDAFGDTDGPAPIYGIDNNTCGKLAVNPSTGAARSIVGLFIRVDADAPSGANAIAWFGPEGVAMAQALATAQSSGARDICRGVFTSLGGATTYAAGVLTGPVNTALPTQDGLTPAVGEVFWAPKGLTNLPAAAQAGPWQFLALGSGSTQWVACRPWWYASGSVIPLAFVARIGPEGSGPLSATRWMAFCAPGLLVDTGDPLFWPQVARVGATLGAGGITPAIVSIPVRSWPGSRITFIPSTLASDGTVTLWRPTSVTPGPLGTATFTITGESTAGTAVAGARTVGEVEVCNW